MIGEPKLLLGKVAAITGGLTGIGRAIAIGFIKHGCKVAISHLGGSDDEKALKAMYSELASHTTCFITVPGDISMPETGGILVEAVVKRWGRLDIFVSNAGICQFVDFLEYFSIPCAVVAILNIWQYKTSPLLPNGPHQSRWQLLRDSGSRSTDGFPESIRWINHRDFLGLCFGRRRAASALHTYESWHIESDAKLCRRAWEAWYQMQCFVARHHQNTDERSRPQQRREKNLHGETHTSGEDRSA